MAMLASVIWIQDSEMAAPETHELMSISFKMQKLVLGIVLEKYGYGYDT